MTAFVIAAGAAVREQTLNGLKIAFLGLVYLFFARVLWAVWSEVRTPVAPKAMSRRDRAAGTAIDGGPKPGRGGRGKEKGAFSFVIIEPRHERGHRFTLSNVLTVGRNTDCDISVPDDAFMSGHHARIEVRPEGAWVVDLGSTNGSFVNGRRVETERQVHKGDRVQFGGVVLETKR